MSETASSFSTMISSLIVETSVPNTMLGTNREVEWLHTYYRRRRSAFSLALRANWLTYYSLHLLIRIPRMWL